VDFNFAFLCLLPKGTKPGDEVHIVRSPENTRPLSLSNSDGKIFAICVKNVLEPPVAGWAAEEQAGFVQGRQMLKNIADVEMVGASLSAEMQNRAAMIFFDFAAAFPSLAHAFLWMALEMMGVPVGVIYALKACYKGCWHWLRYGRACLRVFAVLAGVKQGCPLSPLLFFIATDPFIRAVKSTLHPQSAIRAYADDIAIIVRNLWREGPAIAAMFELYKKATCLALKDQKCVVVPLWSYTPMNVRDMLLEILPIWSRFKVEDSALYLGLWIGPGARHKSWESALCNYQKRVEMLLTFKAGMWISCLLYRVFAFSSLSFVAQAKRIPAQAFKAEKKAIMKILGGPGNWISLPIAFRMDDLFRMPGAFPSLKAVGLAAKTRLAITVFPDLSTQKQQFQHGIRSNEASCMSSLGNHNWWNDALFFVLHDALKEAADLGIICKTWSPGLQQKHLQKLLAKNATDKLFPSSAKQVFIKRFQRWDHLLDGAVERAAERAELLLEKISKKVPPAVLAAWMHTALNGWCTARRFQAQGPCRLSVTCRGEDSLEHYATCRFSWSCAQKRLRIAATPRSFGRFLALQAVSEDEAVLLCVQQAAVYHAVNNLRARNVRAGEGEACNLINARINRLATFSNPLARLLRGRWTLKSL
jgi:hypothetical protein